jgi:hypothetical protein
MIIDAPIDASFWRDCEQSIANEDLVARIHAVELLESQSPYPGAAQPYFQRVEQAVQSIPREFRFAALLVFANVFYLPQRMLDTAWQYLWAWFVKTKYRNVFLPADIHDIHFFEVDPSGFTNRFVHVNHLHGRLDSDLFVRVNSADGLLDQLNYLLHPISEFAERAGRNIRKLASKKHWVILVDKALSGQSVSTDLKRYALVLEIFREVQYPIPRVTALCQVLTADAEVELNKQIEEIRTKQFDIHAALRFGNQFKINSSECRLLDAPDLRMKVMELCQWFANEFITHDPQLDRMRARSGDDLRFGYRACGLTMVDHDNCSTSSLPLLWHESAAYKPPFPRTHSRIGSQREEPTSQKWSVLATPERRKLVIDMLRNASGNICSCA